MRTVRPYVLLLASLVTATVAAEPVTETPVGEAVERHLSPDEPISEWLRDPSRLATEAGDTVAIRDVLVDDVNTIKLTNLVPPIRFESGVAQIPPDYVAKLREILKGMRHRNNVRLHLVGHADNQPLSDRLVGVFGDNAGLSRERAGEVAEYIQTALALPPEAISFEWAGDTQPIASNDTAAGRALNRRVEVEVWYDELGKKAATEEYLVPADIKQVKVCRMETVCRLRYKEGHAHRTRVKNLVPPLHYDDETTAIPDVFLGDIRQALENLADKQNVTVKFIGYTDDAPLTGRTERIYGTPLALSKARAQRVALAVQDALHLPTSEFASDGRGTDRPVASNETVQGRALNRRVEVEFWHDDPLQELPDEPQICPEATGADLVTKVYDPPWGSIAPLTLEGGRAIIPPGYTEMLRRALADVSDKTHPRLRFVGLTANERLDRRTALVYGDDIGLSTARARRAEESIREALDLTPEQTEHEGRGYVYSNDVVNAGFVQGETSEVRVEVVYDELAILDDYEGVDVTRLTRELSPKNPLGLNLMRITVDGEPVDDPNRSSEDIQRCTDVALEQADIKFRFDNMVSSPRLAVSAQPNSIPYSGSTADEAVAATVRFRMYTNYGHFIARSEVRIFDQEQSLEAAPLDVVDIQSDGYAEWQPDPEWFVAPTRELKFVLRAYDEQGHFDETAPQPLWMVYRDSGEEGERDGGPQDLTPPDATPAGDDVLAASYGESALSLHNIPLGSGTVTVQGSGVPPAHTVWIAGRQVPTDAQGNFVAQEILPEGMHTVEVAVLDEAGNGQLYLRDLEFKQNDWFYVGLADLTLSQNDTSGPAELLQGANNPQPYDSSADGRLAFFVDGKFGDHWRLTASADTREEPLENLFSNFMSKSPDSLFRRIDPDLHYPTFGDDSVVEEMAPTLGKFYVKLDQRENHLLWGNFKVGYMDNELAQVDRGLYGANLHYQSVATTSFGEQRLAADGFAAEPGTVNGRDEFRGTGGSLYFLRHQDILTGSERVRIELRDKDSGIVTGVVNLQPAIDYDVDYLQGRILLADPLNSTVDDHLLVRTGGLSGDEAYLVVRYEYTPGFDQLDALSTGGQVHYWVGDHVKVGLTANQNDDGDTDSSLGATDVTLRLSAQSWVKLQASRSEGLVSDSLMSNDGGFGFTGYDTTTLVDASADAYRADVSIGMEDFIAGSQGRLTLYTQNLGAGYSAPGLTTLSDTDNFGGTFIMPLFDRVHIAAKADQRTQEQGIETNAQELDLGYQFNDHWLVSGGVRNDERTDNSPIVPLTQDEGQRTDAVVQLAYDSRADWRAYGFVQDTLSTTGDRQENGRVGTGGSYRFTDRFRADFEVSDGDLGMGGRLGTNYLYSERTNLYLNYSLDNEEMANGVNSRRGNLTSGVKRRLTDSTSVYLEERYQDTDTLRGLTHATGISLAPNERWNLAANTDIGTLEDTLTGAETKRQAGGVRVGYGFRALQLSSGLEYRRDDTEQPDLSVAERTTWLLRNSFKVQLTPDWRIVGKFNHADSTSSLGDFYDGGYTEAVLGYAYRPVDNDRLNALAKYTYFYNVPTTDQVTLQNTAAQFIQKSHVAAFDLSYDLTPSWTVGGKYAYRLGQVSLDRENPDFFDNSASLYIARVDWRFREHWEGLMEGRLLDMADLDEQRSGALVAVYRYMGDHVKVGAGYNFTDFSEDLTDLSFTHQGVFLNIIGTM
jgi:flagellar motor protein MotB